MLFYSVNGQCVDHVGISDRGLAYGDGLFTTAKIAGGVVLLLDQHIARLQHGCRRLAIIAPDLLQLRAQLGQIAEQFERAVIKVIISAGQGGRGYSRIGVGAANVIISVHAFPRHYDVWSTHGITLGNAVAKLGLNPMLSGIKHLNRLEQVMIRQELDQRDEDDILVCDLNGHLVETSCANIFWFANKQWHTPTISDAGIAGLMRQQVLENFSAVQVCQVNVAAAAQASAMFICNSVMGLVPVKQYNDKQLNIEQIIPIAEAVL
jgi:4-amino-4-deoxychorismate lyase